MAGRFLSRWQWLQLKAQESSAAVELLLAPAVGQEAKVTNAHEAMKPDGVSGCEIWVKVGATPSGPSDLTYLALDTRSPYVAEYDDGDAGKIAHYRLRWLSTRGEPGPWSQVVSGTITA